MPPQLTREQHLDLYYFMQLDRQLEERLVRLHRQNKIIGGVYSSLGQEAISVGTAYALEKRDWLAPMIRNIGALLVKGFQPRDIFTQHMGKFTSPTRGKDGTSHFGDLKDRHVVSPISMLGDLIPVMAGVAMAGRYLGQKIVAMTWIGDGGSSTGVFHEGLNFAAVQHAPFVLVIENNQWAYSTPVSRHVPIRDLANRAAAYGITSAIADGNDVLAVYQAAKSAVDQCRAGRGPMLIEVKTMRMKGHAQHDPAEYVPKEMLEFWKTQDPIEALSALSHRAQTVGRENEIRNRCAHKSRARRGSKICGGISDASSRACRAGRLLRRLPYHRSRLAAAAEGSHAACRERACCLEGYGLWRTAKIGTSEAGRGEGELRQAKWSAARSSGAARAAGAREAAAGSSQCSPKRTSLSPDGCRAGRRNCR